MSDIRKKVISYLASLNYRESQEILNRVAELDSIESQSKYEKNQKAYKKQVEKHREMGELMKITVVPGDIVKCRGTNDRQGIREVLECTEYGIKARKIQRRVRYIRDTEDSRKTTEITYERAGYITQHSWDKVAKIFEKDEITVTGA